MHFHSNVIEQILGPIQRGPLQPADLMSISADRLADSVSTDLEPSTVDLLISSDYFLVHCWHREDSIAIWAFPYIL